MKITLTGADERTPIDELLALAADYYPLVEIGLLFTATPEGRNRYPRMEWLMEAVNALSGRCALHVCGGAARAMLCAGELDSLTRHAARVQVNGTIKPEELPILAARVQTLITQHCPANYGLVDIDVPNHVLLVDGSGGRGISPDTWSRPATNKAVGFAGGLGLDNLRAEMCKIAIVAEGDWWIDMEGKLRKDDWFDVREARAVAGLFETIVGEVVERRPAFVVNCKHCGRVQAVAVAEDDSTAETAKVGRWLADAARRNNTEPRLLKPEEEIPESAHWCRCHDRRPSPKADVTVNRDKNFVLAK